ncbi:MAG: acetyl-CoA C-acyltransferase [Halioglobus sp.]
MKPVYVYDAIRTPRGKAKESGGLHDLTPHALLENLYRALRDRTGLDPALVGEVILGCVTQHGEQAGNIAKTSALYAGWPYSVSGLTVNRFCSSSIDAISLGALKIGAGHEEAIVSGGIEMMSRAPMLSDDARVFNDPAFAARCQMLLMGSGADLIATLNGVDRQAADAIALASQQKAAAAAMASHNPSRIPVYNPIKKITVAEDECARPNTTAESLARLAPAFEKIGQAGADAFQLASYPQLEHISHVHTAGNSPAMADAAALVLLGTKALGDRIGAKPRARIIASATACDEPLQVLSGCISAARRLMEEQKLAVDDIDLFEVHEAFAATMVKAQRELSIPEDKLNVNGGVIALGHPMGATGGIMTGVLLDELERRDQTLGLVSASGAGGSGSALLIERC